MERFEIDADRAFSTLRRYSQHHNIKLKVLCHQLPSPSGADPSNVMAAALPEPTCDAERTVAGSAPVDRPARLTRKPTSARDVEPRLRGAEAAWAGRR